MPAHWRYRDGHDALERAGRLIDTELAERRNLIMANPIDGNTYNTSATLVAAYQMLLPGEHARSHRHTPNALRLIVESDAGAYTIVNGEKIDMLPGDVVLTPSWMWHGHGNDGQDPRPTGSTSSTCRWCTRSSRCSSKTIPTASSTTPRPSNASPLRFTLDLDRSPAERGSPTRQGRFGRQVTLDTPSLKTIRLHMHAHAAGTKTGALPNDRQRTSTASSRAAATTTIDGTTCSRLGARRPTSSSRPAVWRPHTSRTPKPTPCSSASPTKPR